MKLLAIDPGNSQSGWCIIDTGTCQPILFGKTDNRQLRSELSGFVLDRVVIEMVASYGMAVGAEVFDTCVWIGRFFELANRHVLVEPELIKRLAVKVHHCHTAKAKDANIRQALADRFAPGQPNYGKGTKASPGWFYGFHADVWQAYALAVYAADKELQ